MLSIKLAKPNGTFIVENCDCSKGSLNGLDQSQFYIQYRGRHKKTSDFISFLVIGPVKIIQTYAA
jgi:hypothetical protein